jgi:hypothetical protein
MRGPLFSGPIGSSVTLERLAQIARARGPVAVLSSAWLALQLAEAQAGPVLLLIEADARSSGARARRKAEGRSLLVVVAGDRVPLARASVGTLVVEGLGDVDEGASVDFLHGLAPVLAPDGALVALDNTKDPQLEARLAGELLAAGLTHLAQERPREGALLTIGRPPPALLLAPPPAVAQPRG